METDPRWVDIANKNLEEVLIDHAFCEQKAASNAISIIVQYPKYTDLVKDMTAICMEEMEHFDMVHQKLLDRGLKLGYERKDPYVNDLSKYLKKNADGSKENHFVNQNLFGQHFLDKFCFIKNLVYLKIYFTKTFLTIFFTYKIFD